jgi:hypothetical protein
MRFLRYAWPALPVALLLCGLNGAGAQGQVDVRQACTPDAMRLCSEFIPDADRVRVCMLAKRRMLSAECLGAMRASHRPVRVARHYRTRVHHYCRHGHCR